MRRILSVLVSLLSILLGLASTSISIAEVWPLSASKTPDTIDSDYGPRYYKSNNNGKLKENWGFHYGLDFFVNTVSVKSITATTISDIRLAPTSKTGNYVQTANGFRYLHLSAKTATY